MKDEADPTLWHHVRELRQTAIKCALAILVASCCCFLFHQNILNGLTTSLSKKNKFSSEKRLYKQEIKKERITNLTSQPIEYKVLTEEVTPILISPLVKRLDSHHFQIPSHEYLELEYIPHSTQLVILGPLDGIGPALKVSGWVGFVISSPLWLHFIFQFIYPALREEERKLIFPFFALSFFFMALGAFLGFSVILPLASHSLEAFNSEIGINMWSLSEYLQFTLYLLLANTLSFELSVIFFILVHFGIVDTQMMIKKRRHAIVLAFILGALLTPPDILTQCALAIPFIGLYEAAILYAKFRNWVTKETLEEKKKLSSVI